jgi:hypothetical protein
MAIRDGDWVLFDHDIQLGRSVWKRVNDDGSVTFRTDYQVDRMIEQNRVALNESHGQRWDGGRRVASIPLNLFYDQLDPALMQGDDKFLSRWLNDGDNAAFRTFGGRV